MLPRVYCFSVVLFTNKCRNFKDVYLSHKLIHQFHRALHLVLLSNLTVLAALNNIHSLTMTAGIAWEYSEDLNCKTLLG